MTRLAFLLALVMAFACSDRDPPAGTDAGGGTDSGAVDAASGEDAPAMDAGEGEDAATGEDAGAEEDAGAAEDAGAEDDAGAQDAGPADAGRDGGTSAGPMCDESACTPTCFRPIDCVIECGGRSIHCGCCACAEPAFDDISCGSAE